MALILERLSTGYNFVFKDMADERVESFFLMSSPVPIFAVVAFYLYFVLNLGPRLMKNRAPFDLERVLVVYNVIQIAVCAYLVIQSARYTVFSYSLICEPVDYSDTEEAIFVARHVWIYFMLKLTDLLDTVFFVLRKKNNQVSFLHVYHHTGMCLLGWFGTKYIAGGHGVMVGFLNSIVHIVMYTYYLLSAWDKEYKKNVWWKKHITQLQLVQFVILVVYFTQLLFQPNCPYPKYTVFFFVPQNILMIVLFSQFYVKNYIQPQQKSKIANNVSSTGAKIKHVKKSE